MREWWPAVFLVAFGLIVLLLVVSVTLSHLRRLRTVRDRTGADWEARTGALRSLVNARARRRDEQESSEWTRARRGRPKAGAA